MKNRIIQQRAKLRATDLADMGFCEQKCLLKSKHGDMVTPETQAARDRGHVEHQRFDHQVRLAHNTGAGKGRDRRCFIASAVYGVNDPRTDALRAFRDEYLMPSRIGRMFVKLYYTVSPPIAVLCEQFPLLRTTMKYLLDGIRRQLGMTTSADAKKSVRQERKTENPYLEAAKQMKRRINIENTELASLIHESYSIQCFLNDMGDVEADVDSGMGRDTAVELWVRFEHAIWNLQEKQKKLLAFINLVAKKQGLHSHDDPLGELVATSAPDSRIVWAIGMYRGEVSVYQHYRACAGLYKTRIEMVVATWVHAKLTQQHLHEQIHDLLEVEAKAVHAKGRVKQYWYSPENGGYCQFEVEHP